MTRKQAEAEIYKAFHKFPIAHLEFETTDFGAFYCKATFPTKDYAMAAISMLPAHWTLGEEVSYEGLNKVNVYLYLDKYIE